MERRPAAHTEVEPPPVALPPPPPSPPPHVPTNGTAGVRLPEPGELTIGWRTATAIAWGLVFVGYIAVWKTSRELGLNTWWLGPIGDPSPPWVSFLPFLAPLTMVVLALNNVRGLFWFGLAATAVCAAIAAFDIADVPRLALVQFAIAAAALLVTLGGLAGRYRKP